jgi:hypothetical protein
MDEFCGNGGASEASPSARHPRAALLRAGGALAAAGAMGSLLLVRPEPAGTAPSKELDREIFRFALQLEYLQAAFYAAAVDAGSLRGEVLEFAEIVAGHEQAHVDFLRKALGASAPDAPAFDFGRALRDERAFLDAAELLENTGVAAYNGQAANLTKPSLAAAAQIVSVEGRHAAWVSALAGHDPAPRAADPGEPARAITATIQRTGFLR